MLASHAKDGRVEYEGLRRDPRLSQYLAQLAVTDPEKLSAAAEQLAFWLNAYSFKLVVDRQPAKSIVEIGTGCLMLGFHPKTTAWGIRFADVVGKKYTLNRGRNGGRFACLSMGHRPGRTGRPAHPHRDPLPGLHGGRRLKLRRSPGGDRMSPTVIAFLKASGTNGAKLMTSFVG